jgi:hypothetical protein
MPGAPIPGPRNDDCIQPNFCPCKSHKWFGGVPFPAEDVAFWYNNIPLDTNIIARLLHSPKPLRAVVALRHFAFSRA